ncbi:uncharacterized protein RAG0_00874 [Rhynchosporium agropyri]|uniref:Uncharacterized protein n=1 Tax=Rhynchosporium agropyri TaxID=914238 RepID=A0A1E1JUD6_9HELO|nr:uncharacterized protein RAG0_00874 [Rhynchosporium agropyri]
MTPKILYLALKTSEKSGVDRGQGPASHAVQLSALCEKSGDHQSSRRLHLQDFKLEKVNLKLSPRSPPAAFSAQSLTKLIPHILAFQMSKSDEL